MNIYLETYGCTANKSDEAVLKGILQQHKHRIVDTIKDAEVLVLLTCTVISTTEQRMLSRLKVFQHTHKQIVVTGCMASAQPALVTSIAPQAILLPPQHIQYIHAVLQPQTLVFKDTKKTLLPRTFTGIIAPLLIAEGCQRSCSYCITHVARGRLHSYPVSDIVADVRSVLNQGCREIQLTAQDTAAYGLDIGTTLGELLTQICKINKPFRIRVGMMNPVTLLPYRATIFSAYSHPKVYKFLHLPVQSGDDDILEKMNRGYTVNDFTTLVNRYKASFPSGTLSTDVIIGFPTETDEQFQRTMNLIHHLKPDIINITRFSARPQTSAKTMSGRVPTHIVKERSRQMTRLCAAITYENNTQHLKKQYQVLVTERGKNNTWVGRTEHYKPVVITGPVHLGDVRDVLITKVTSTYLVGTLI
ncbi:MAG: tRNA (N(6)-L-threonylcarbamoyladenosine(37)-C(2))-methylthiotransferase [Candidatus Thermoplasmatota archaeon]|nr:tRNA (N(6)-L-threonylcarbamoyladenosine(37)-C(2))-methylthiotransferase [Candidatus Thermoplasmatota archaeon]